MTLGAGTSFSANADDQRAFALSRVVMAVTNRLGLPQAMEMACLSATEALDADHSALVIFEEDGHAGKVVAEHGGQIFTKGLRVPLDSPLEQDLMRTGRTIKIEDVAKCLELGSARAALNDLGIRSILIVPILVSGRVVGSLGVDRLERRGFTDEDEKLCRSVASLIAIAVERPERCQPRPAMELDPSLQARLREATLGLVTPITRSKTLECIVQHAVDLVQARDGGLYLYDPHERQLRMVAVHGKSEAGRRLDTVLEFGEGMAGHLIATGVSHLVTPDYRLFDGKSQNPGATPCYDAVLEVPMPGVEHPRGVIFVESPRGRIYTPDEIQALRWFAEYASVWLGYAEQVEWQQHGLQLMQQTTCVLTRAKDLPAGLNELSRLIVTLLKHFCCRIFLADEHQQSLTPVAYAVVERRQPLTPIASRWEEPIRGGGKWGTAVKDARQFLRWSQPRDREALELVSRRLGLERPLKSLLRVPLALGDRLIGVIEIGEMRDESRAAMTEATREMLGALAEQVAVLIDRVRQQDRVQRVARLLGDLETYSASLGEITEEDKLPPEYLRLSTVLFPGTVGALFRYNRSLQTLELMRTYPPSDPAPVWSAALDHSVLGQAVLKDTICSVPAAEARSTARQVFGDRGIEWLVATPMRMPSGVEYVLLLGDPTGQWLRGEPDLAILERLTARAASALANSRLINQEPSLAASMNRLQHIVQYMHLAKTLDALLQICLTGVTANYGLRFNRAAVFLLDDAGATLEGVGAVGDHHTWGNQAAGFDGFPQFIHALELGQLPASTLHQAFAGLEIELGGDDVFSQVIEKHQLSLVDPERFAELPAAVKNVFEPVHQVIVVPLLAGDEAQGLLIADNAFTGTKISELDVLSLLNYARGAAFAIRDRRNKDHALAGERLRRLYKASATLRILDDPRTVAQDFVDRLIDAAGANGVSATFIDDHSRIRERFVAGATARQNHPAVFRANGVSYQVIESGAPIFISDTSLARESLNPAMDLELARACACLPLSLPLPDRRIGVVWLTYDAPRSFSMEERDALALYAEQATLAYRGAERFALAGDMYELLHDQSEHADPRRAMEQLVGLAKQKFGARSATIWPYDAEFGKFIPQDLMAVGIPEPELTVFRETEPGEGHTTFTALKEGYLEVADVDGERYQFLLPAIRAHLHLVGIRSFQAVTLRAGDDPLGVLYVSYPAPRPFTAHDRETLLTFAKSAAQALSRVRLMARNQQAREAAQAVAKITALGDKRETLKLIAEHTKQVMRSGAVVVLAYNQTTNRFAYPYEMIGVKNRTWKGIEENFPRGSWVTSKLSLTEPEIIDRVDEHDGYKHRRFARDEGIKTLVIVPLRAAERVVGLMFVNFFEHHRFTAEMSNDLNLFANQAAVAIHNTQLFEERAAQDAFSRELLKCATVKEILKAASLEAARAFGASHACVLKADEIDRHYYVSSSVGWDEQDMAGLRLDLQGDSQLAYTIKNRRTVMENDLERARDFVPHELVRRQGLQSGISTCLHYEGEPIGALVVHTTERRQFADHERKLIENIAALTAVAMQGVSKFEGAVQRLSIHDLAIIEGAKAIAAADRGGEGSMLTKLLTQAAHIIGKPTVICTMHRVVREGADVVVTLDGVYPEAQREGLLSKVGQRRSLSNGRIGVVGRAAKTGQTQRVSDIEDDDDYVCFHDQTRSELAVPLYDAELNEVAGVINIESAERDAFNAQHVRALQALVEVAVIALQKTRTSQLLTKTVRDLQDTARTLAGRKTLAWIGMLTNQWRHDIDNATTSAKGELENLEVLLRQFVGSEALPAQLADKLATIRSILAEVHDAPITPPLSSEEGVTWVRLNELLRERATQLSRKPGYDIVTFSYELEINDDATVFVSRAWLRRAFDIVIHNAVKELAHVPKDRRCLTLSTRKTVRGLEIEFKDRGRGFHPKAREFVFTDCIPKSQGEHGLGYGLLMAVAIVETYGGHIEVAETGKEGTSMVIWFPHSTEA